MENQGNDMVLQNYIWRNLPPIQRPARPQRPMQEYRLFPPQQPNMPPRPINLPLLQPEPPPPPQPQPPLLRPEPPPPQPQPALLQPEPLRPALLRPEPPQPPLHQPQPQAPLPLAPAMNIRHMIPPQKIPLYGVRVQVSTFHGMHAGFTLFAPADFSVGIHSTVLQPVPRVYAVHPLNDIPPAQQQIPPTLLIPPYKVPVRVFTTHGMHNGLIVFAPIGIPLVLYGAFIQPGPRIYCISPLHGFPQREIPQMPQVVYAGEIPLLLAGPLLQGVRQGGGQHSSSLSPEVRADNINTPLFQGNPRGEGSGSNRQLQPGEGSSRDSERPSGFSRNASALTPDTTESRQDLSGNLNTSSDGGTRTGCRDVKGKGKAI